MPKYDFYNSQVPSKSHSAEVVNYSTGVFPVYCILLDQFNDKLKYNHSNISKFHEIMNSNGVAKDQLEIFFDNNYHKEQCSNSNSKRKYDPSITFSYFCDELGVSEAINKHLVAKNKHVVANRGRDRCVIL